MQCDVTMENGTALITVVFDPILDRAQVETMARTVETAMEAHDTLRVILDMSATEEIEATAFMSAKGALVSLKSIDPIERYAVVGAPRIAEAAIKFFGKLLPLESRTFEPRKMAEARAWALAPT